MSRARRQSSKARRAPPLLFPLMLLSGFALIAFGVPALGQEFTLDLGGSEEGPLTQRVLQLIALITILSLAPSILVMATSFVRIVVVLSLLRTALGLQQSPPNSVMISLALFLTAFIMAPVFTTAYDQAIKPMMDGAMTSDQALPEAVAPFKTFMLTHARDEDIALFLDMTDADIATMERADVPLNVAAPAFMISELRRAFEIGFLLFIPFLVIDLVVASVLMSMGMMMLPPVIISLPFKLIFFVLVDGWRLVAGSLVQSFATAPPPI